MICSNCGAEATSDAHFCNAYGAALAGTPTAQQPATGIGVQSTPDLGRMSVPLLVVLVTITFGMYEPIWFLKRRAAFNSLQSREKFGAGVFVFVIVVVGIGLLLTLISVVMADVDGGPTPLDPVIRLLNLVGTITLLVQSFKARRAIHDHYRAVFQRELQTSGVALFFFHELYLQYVINRL